VSTEAGQFQVSLSSGIARLVAEVAGCHHPWVGIHECCGRPDADACRCYTDAAAIADAVHAFVRRRVRRPEDAADVAQDALLRLYRTAGRLRDEEALEGWMYQIARSAIIDHHRRAGFLPEAVDPDVLADGLAAPEDEPIRPAESLAACLRPLLTRLPEDYREALALAELGGLSQADAAAQVGISLSGMKSRVQRGRRLLRAEVGRCCKLELDARGVLAEATSPRPAC
jgi:RNA polymerase sigma-70 factor (ECF subfamily)